MQQKREIELELQSFPKGVFGNWGKMGIDRIHGPRDLDSVFEIFVGLFSFLSFVKM